jgi:hypothetical protein
MRPTWMAPTVLTQAPCFINFRRLRSRFTDTLGVNPQIELYSPSNRFTKKLRLSQQRSVPKAKQDSSEQDAESQNNPQPPSRR